MITHSGLYFGVHVGGGIQSGRHPQGALLCRAQPSRSRPDVTTFDPPFCTRLACGGLDALGLVRQDVRLGEEVPN
jgi:hypothetical protein